MYNIKKIKSTIDEYEYISFDIFDTLIKRNLKQPIDLFLLVEKYYNKQSKISLSNFVYLRIEAEKQARENEKNNEPSLDDIYANLNIDENTFDLKKIKDIEIDLEKKFCLQNQYFYEIYRYAKESGKKIILTSDMYLNKSVIQDILTKAKIHYDYLFISNIEKKNKISGSIYPYILKTLNINESQLLHIGDSKIADYLMPKKYHIKSILIPKKLVNTRFSNLKINNLDYNILLSFINNHILNEWNDYEVFGYEVLGPILYSFITWIYKQTKTNKIEKLFFLARDAKIIMEAFQIKYSSEIPLYYIHVSRKSVLKSVISFNNFEDIMNRYKMMIKDTSNVNDLFTILDLKNKTLKSDFKKLNISLDENIIDLNFEKKELIFNFIKKQLNKENKNQLKYLKQYLNENDFKGNVALVDIGWNGTIQYYFDKLFFDVANINGFYYGVNYNNKYNEYKKLKRFGYLFNQNINSDYQAIIALSLGLFELMFLSTERSTIAYCSKENEIKPIYGASEYTDKNISKILLIQEKAKQFIKDVINSECIDIIDKLDKNVFFENYKNLIVKPKLKTVELFNKFEFQNASTSKLIEHKNIWFYILHPKKLYIEFKNSNCKILFAKSLIKLPLPYYKILKKIYYKSLN